MIDHVDFYLLEGVGKFDLRVHGRLGCRSGAGRVSECTKPHSVDCGVLFIVWVRE